MVLATILSAVVQGLIAGVGYYAVGMPSLILLILLTTVCALIPFVGPALVWGPVVIYLLVYREDTFGATGLFLWGTFVVGTSDNFVKMFVLHGQRQLHPLLALLSVLGGIQALGPIGILVGPYGCHHASDTFGHPPARDGFARHQKRRGNSGSSSADHENRSKVEPTKRKKA